MISSDKKKSHAVSYEKMSPALTALFNAKYPRGYSDYLQDLTKFSPGINPRTGVMIDPFYAVTLETEEDIYLVKIKVDLDDVEDIERWLEGEEEAEAEAVAGATGTADPSDGTLPDDNISQYDREEDSVEG